MDKTDHNFIKLKNPYTFGVPVRGESKFFGREEELGIVFDSLENVPRGQKQDIAIMGPRRIGKSSLLYRLNEALISNDEFVPIYIDVQNIKPQKARLLFLKLISEIKKGYEKRGFRKNFPDFQTLNDNIPADLEFYRFNEDMGFLNEWIATQNAPRLVLLFDEIEILIEFGGRDTLGWFRGLIQSLTYCIFIVAGSDYLYTLTQDHGSPFYNIFKGIEIHPLSDEAALSLIRKPAKEIGLQITLGNAKKILGFSGNVPYFIQGITHYLIEELNTQKRYDVLANDIEKVAKSCIENFSSQFMYYWEKISVVEKAILFLISEKRMPQTIDGLLKNLPKSDIFDDIINSKQTHQEVFADLIQQQILKKEHDGYYWFVVPLFASWIIAKVDDEELIDLGLKSSITSRQTINSDEIRELILNTFTSNEELAAFIFEEFQPYYANITLDTSLAKMASYLVRYATRRRELDKLDEAIRNYNPIRHDHFSKKSYTDFAIVTVLDVELDALLEKLHLSNKYFSSDKDPFLSYPTRMPVKAPNGRKIVYNIVVVHIPKIGRVGAALATSEIIRRWQPKYIIKVGVAGGFTNRGVNLGDILVADQIVDYEMQKITRSGPEIRWETYRTDMRLAMLARNLADADWQHLIKVTRPVKGKPKIHIGPMASGDKIIASSQVAENLQHNWPKLIGVEMETAGIAAAITESSRQPGLMTIQGVSDLVDENKISESWRFYASDVAASFLVGLLKAAPSISN